MNVKAYKGRHMTSTKGISFKECELQKVMKIIFKERKENFL